MLSLAALWSPRASLRQALVSLPLLACTALPALAQSGPGYYVDADALGANNGTSWADAFTSLQDALAAADGAEIWVAEGVYYPDEGAGQTDNDRNSTFNLRLGTSNTGARIYGGFAGTETERTQRDPDAYVTVLSGDLEQNDTNRDAHGIPASTSDLVGSHAYNVVTVANYFVNAPLLDGVTITSGQAAGGHGGGLSIEYTSNALPELYGVTFVANEADYGGAVGILGGGVSLHQCTFTRNHATIDGGVLHAFNGGAATFTDATITDNSAGQYGGGFYLTGGATLTITRATITGNSASQGGALYNDGGSGSSFTRILITDNTPDDVVVLDGTPTFESSAVGGGCPTGSTCQNVEAASIWSHVDMSAAVYVWDVQQAKYLTRSGGVGDLPDGVIPAMEAFWVQATGSSPLLAMSGEARASDNASTTLERVLDGPAGWHLIAPGLQGVTLEGLLGSTWIQGFPGADVEHGTPNVSLWDEQQGGVWVLPTSADQVIEPGQGVATFVFEDSDYMTPGLQGGFPKTLSVTGSSVAEDPFVFPLTYYEADPLNVDVNGWNLVGNAGGSSIYWDGDVPSTTQRQAQDEQAMIELMLSGTVNGVAREAPTFVVFRNDAGESTDAFDAHALEPLSAPWLMLSAVTRDGAALKINALPPLTGERILPLSIRTSMSTSPARRIEAMPVLLSPTPTAEQAQAQTKSAPVTFALSWPHLDVPGDWELLLRDTATGVETDLRTAGTYVFDHQQDGADRFELVVRPAALPVELASFEAVRDGDAAVLSWTTASETANAGFEVQQADAASPSWKTLAFVEGAGTTTEAQHYSHVAHGLEPGTYRFRLRQLDHDGTTSTSREVEVTIGMEEAVRLSAPYPNPAAQQAQVELAVREAQHVRVVLYDALGRSVQVALDAELAAEETQRVDLDVRRLPAGLYVLRAEGETFQTSQTLTVVP